MARDIPNSAPEASPDLSGKRKNAGPSTGEIDSCGEHAQDISPDERPNLAAQRETVREHGDAYVVDTDLEDADQREASPGTREQS